MASIDIKVKSTDQEEMDAVDDEVKVGEKLEVKSRSVGATARRGRGKRVTRSSHKVEEESDSISEAISEVDRLVKEVEVVSKDDNKTTNQNADDGVVEDERIEGESVAVEDNESNESKNEECNEGKVKDDGISVQLNGIDSEQLKLNEKQVEHNDVPELDAPSPPTITKAAPISVKIRTTSQASESEPVVEAMETDAVIQETAVEASGSDSDVQELTPVKEVKEIEQIDLVDDTKPSPEVDSHVESLEGMTVIDEICDESDATIAKKDNKKDEDSIALDPDTEMVSEDELPAEVNKEQLDTEAVSDEELPTSADLPETEAVSEDELPPEGSEKKKKKKKVSASPKDSKGDASKDESLPEGEEPKSKAVKRKLPEGEYDPSSPTSEASNDDCPQAKKSAIDGKATTKTSEKVNKMLPELEKYWKAVRDDPADFTGWTYLLQYVDQENDVEAAREAYDAFLSHYPYCYGYWRKYADYEKRKGNVKKCEEVFERGLKAIPLSVDLWIHYINYCKATYQKDEDFLRGIFDKALDACGLEFRSDRLWEAYIKWETEGKRFQHVTALYDKLLKTPTQGYPTHFENFQEHINNTPPNKSLSVDEFLTLRHEVVQVLKQYDTPLTDSTPPGDEDAPPGEEPPEASTVGSVEEITALRERIVAIRRKIHKATDAAVTARWNFEEGIKRPYFHVKPLERCQLKNWMEYLDYEIEQGDQQRIIVLFERCLIACALYEEFWIRYIRYLEDKCDNMVDKIRDVFERACTIHHTKKPNLHLHWAVYEESHGNYTKAAEILSNLEKVVPNLMQVTYRRINLARRSGDLEGAAQLYEHYIALAAKNRIFANNMSIKYARFCWKVLDDVDKAVAVLKKAVEKDRENPRLYLQMIDMAIQKTPLQEADVVAIIDQFIGRETTELDQKVLFAQRKIEFLEDFGSDVKNVQKATDEFQRLLKQLNDRKKKLPDIEKNKSDEGSKKSKSSTGDTKQTTVAHSGDSTHTGQSPQPQATTTTGTYPATNYNQPGSYSQPPTQGGYQGGQYPQQPYNQPPYSQQYNQSDPNYANYQNWSYSQTGYGNYNQGWAGGYNYY